MGRGVGSSFLSVICGLFHSKSFEQESSQVEEENTLQGSDEDERFKELSRML